MEEGGAFSRKTATSRGDSKCKGTMSGPSSVCLTYGKAGRAPGTKAINKEDLESKLVTHQHNSA